MVPAPGQGARDLQSRWAGDHGHSDRAMQGNCCSRSDGAGRRRFCLLNSTCSWAMVKASVVAGRRLPSRRCPLGQHSLSPWSRACFPLRARLLTSRRRATPSCRPPRRRARCWHAMASWRSSWSSACPPWPGRAGRISIRSGSMGSPAFCPPETSTPGAGPRCILRFAGPVLPAWREMLAALGWIARFDCPPSDCVSRSAPTSPPCVPRSPPCARSHPTRRRIARAPARAGSPHCPRPSTRWLSARRIAHASRTSSPPPACGWSRAAATSCG